jgi:amino acid adenylation domain-containing protein
MNQTEALSHSHLLTEAQRQKMLVDWNATELQLPDATSIHALIEQKASESPDALALVCRDDALTYSGLNARAAQLAAHLRKLGVGPETLVGICVERSLEMVTGLLAILKSGGAYVPLDPTYPKERLAFMLEDSKPLVLITESTLLTLLPQSSPHIVCLNNFNWAASLDPSRNTQHATRNTQHAPVLRSAFGEGGSPLTDHASRLTPHPSPLTHNASLAYVLYTSGSTGKPKGVMVEHGNVLNFFAAMDACVPRGVDATWLAITSPSFDISVLELFWTLSRGFKVVLYPGDQAGLVAEEYSIPALIRRHRVTHLQCTPSGAKMMLLDQKTRSALSELQTILIGGEAFPAKLARELREVFKGTLLNMYGPTETTVWSTTWQLPPQTAPDRIPIGRPIANTQIYIVDSNLQPVPIGVEGELLIGGAGVARGYLDRDQLTAERFIPNPFLQPSALDTRHSPLLYRTGDLARYLPDGNIELLGRIDQQVKIRGHRVELGEIEARINEHPDVRESVVLLRGLANGEQALVAYVIPREAQPPTPDELRQHAQQKLPDFMVPARVVFMTAFPQTPNRKIDRNAFPPPEADVPEQEPELEQSAAPIQDALAALWKELLGVNSIGREDNFFEAGGHSMLAMQLVAKVRKHFNIDFRLKNVFERQTLAGMAEIIEAMSWSDFVKTPRPGEREVVDV